MFNLKKIIKHTSTLLITLIIISFSLLIYFNSFKDIFNSSYMTLDFGLKKIIIDNSYLNYHIFDNIKSSSIFFFITSELIILKSIYSNTSKYIFAQNFIIQKHNIAQNSVSDGCCFSVNIGQNSAGFPVKITEFGLYQNVLITGTIGTGKTSSAMYPITKQLINYLPNDKNQKMGILILDVKGNYCNEVKRMVKDCKREKDLIEIKL